MEKIEFLIQGSSDEPYKVVIEKRDKSIRALCDCKAAVNGMHCKHRINILKGEDKNIVSNNNEQVNTVSKWLKDTDLEQILNIYLQAEQNAERAKRQLAKAKKDLVKTMD